MLRAWTSPPYEISMTKPHSRLTRRFAVAALAASLASAALAQTGEVALPDDMTVGKAKAKVTVVEYASVGCPHCAAFHIQVWPEFKDKYVDTGRVRFVYREVLAGHQELAMAGFITARCVPARKYFDVIDSIYRQQPQLVASPDLTVGLKAIAVGAGVRPAKFDACMADPKARTTVAERSDSNAEAGQVKGTPQFSVNGVQMKGGSTLANLEAAVEAAEAAL